MKKNKLQEYADKSLEKYDNKEIREQFIGAKAEGNERVLNNNNHKWFVCLAIILFCAAVLLGSYMLFMKPPKEKHYLQENQQKINIAENELTANISNLFVNNQYLISCQCINDISYNETLYYEITFHNEESNEELRVIIVTNGDYEYSFTHYDYNKQSDYLDIRYIEKFVEDDGVFMFDCRGEFINNNIRYCVIYEGIGLEPQSNFIGFLKQCVNLK